MSIYFYAEIDDYSPVNETLVFGADLPTEMCVVMTVSEDDLVEETETVSLEVTTDDPAVLLLQPTTAVVSIVSTDGERAR